MNAEFQFYFKRWLVLLSFFTFTIGGSAAALFFGMQFWIHWLNPEGALCPFVRFLQGVVIGLGGVGSIAATTAEFSCSRDRYDKEWRELKAESRGKLKRPDRAPVPGAYIKD